MSRRIHGFKRLVGPCPKCHGSGQTGVFKRKTCSKCGGTGELAGKPDRFKTAVIVTAIAIFIFGIAAAVHVFSKPALASVSKSAYQENFKSETESIEIEGSFDLLSLNELISVLEEKTNDGEIAPINLEAIITHYSEAVDASVAVGYDPALTLAIWIEESGASHYQKYPDVADFGCIHYDRENFEVQLNCWLGLWEYYSLDPLFAECRGADGLSLREFFLLYEGGFASCQADNFLAEPNFPNRIKYYYNLVSGGNSLDF